MAKYKLTQTGVVLLGNISIPPDPNNMDYRDYLLWLENGNMPDPPDPLPLVEIKITPSQQIILADGVDIAKTTITGEPGAIVEYTVNGEPFSETLNESGSQTIELTCDTPNTTIVVQAGTARAVVYAVEVPS